MKLWLSRRRYLAALQPFHESLTRRNIIAIHRVNCAVFVLIWSFEDSHNTTRCSIQIRSNKIIVNMLIEAPTILNVQHGWKFMLRLSFNETTWGGKLNKIIFYRWLCSVDGGSLIFGRCCKQLLASTTDLSEKSKDLAHLWHSSLSFRFNY